MSTAPKAQRPYQGKSPRRRKRERRERLLASGLELFGTQGFRATTIEQLCKHARVTTRHFYEEFGSREGIFTAVFDRTIEHVAGSVMRAAAEAPEDPAERARVFIGAAVSALLQDPRIARIQSIELLSLGEEFFGRQNESYRGLALLLISEARRAAELEKREIPTDIEHTALAIAAAMGDFVIQSQVTRPGLSPGKITDTIVSLFLLAAGIRNPGKG